MAKMGRLARRRATMRPPGNASVTSAVTVYRPARRTISCAKPGAAAARSRIGANWAAGGVRLIPFSSCPSFATDPVQGFAEGRVLAGQDRPEVEDQASLRDARQDRRDPGAQRGRQAI